MADTQILDSPSQSSSLPLSDAVESVEDLCFDGGLAEDLRASAICEYGEEVVLDSEDEEVHESKKVVAAVKVIFNDKAVGRFRGSLLDLQKGQPCPPSNGKKNVEANPDNPNHEKSSAGGMCNEGNEESSIHLTPFHPPVSDQNLPRLNYISSQEPGESSQDNALNFVDRFLSFSKVGLSPGVDKQKTVMLKSPPIPSAKGPRCLVKRITRQAPVANLGTFEWTETGQLEGGDFLSKGVEESVAFGERRQKSLTKYQEARDLANKESVSSVNERSGNDEFPDLRKETIATTDSRPVLYGSKQSRSTLQVTEDNATKEMDDQLEVRLTGEQLEHIDVGTDIHNMFDIGFSTQIAAEAMEALACAPPAGCSDIDAYQGLESTIDQSLTGASENQSHLRYSLCQADTCSDIGNIPRKLPRRKRSARRFSRGSSGLFQNQSQTKELDSELVITEVKRGNSSSEKQLHSGNPADANGSSSRTSDKTTIQRNAEGSSGRAKLRELEVGMCSSISASLGKGQSKGNCMTVSPVAHQTRPWMSGVKLIRTMGELDNRRERTNDGSITHFRRKRSRIAADPVEVLSAREKCSNSSQDPGIGLLSQHDRSTKDVISNSYLISNPWRHPRRKRTRRNVQSHSNGPKNISASFATVYQKGSDVHSNKSQKRSEDNDNMNGNVGLSVYIRPHWHSSENNCDRSILLKNVNEPSPAGATPKCESAVINTRSIPARVFADGAEKNLKWDVSSKKIIKASGSENTIAFGSTNGRDSASANCLYYKHHKQPCYKNLPKSSLLKELIKLGVPHATPNLAWKDLRKRRDMAYVRVLFSQHLDDNIIKQQKKILSRLGISLASSCGDATHFIADKFARTRNMLEAIALGKPVVTHLWLESCGQASCLIDEKNYILRDTKKEKEIGFSMPVSLACAREHPLLRDRRVFITPSIKPGKELITSLVKASHGQPVETSQISATKDEKILHDLLILSCEEDHAICKPFLEKGAAAYKSELLLNGIVIQKLEFKRHKLFIN